jgi:hypothetical protein
VVENARFTLAGDRNCGAWSECQQTTFAPSNVCWRFRLQGHNEFPPRDSAAQGVLTVTYSASNVASEVQSNRGIIYVEFFDERNRDLAQRLRTLLQTTGYVCPLVERVDSPFKSSVRYFQDDDLKLALEVRALAMETVLAAKRDVTFNLLNLSAEYRVQPKQIEIWLNPNKTE